MTTSGNTLRTEVLDLVCGIKKCQPDDLGDRRDFASALAFDSLDLIELLGLLETAYGIRLGDEPGDIAALDDVDALVVLVRRRGNR